MVVHVAGLVQFCDGAINALYAGGGVHNGCGYFAVADRLLWVADFLRYVFMLRYALEIIAPAEFFDERFYLRQFVAALHNALQYLPGANDAPGDVGREIGDGTIDVVSVFSIKHRIYAVYLLQYGLIICRKYLLHLSLADFIHGNLLLAFALKTQNFGVSLLLVFLANAAVYAFSPQVETAALEFPAHEGNDVGLGKAKLDLNGLKRGSVFPRHFYDSVNVCYIHLSEKLKGLSLPFNANRRAFC
jgi:hypothetical protein